MGWEITKPSDIYAIRCKENGRVYIGRTADLKRRINEHFRMLRRCQKYRYNHKTVGLSEFQKDFNKYGEDAFEIYIIEKSVLPENCMAREAFWITEYKATNPKYGYNFKDETLKPVGVPIKVGKPPLLQE